MRFHLTVMLAMCLMASTQASFGDTFEICGVSNATILDPCEDLIKLTTQSHIFSTQNGDLVIDPSRVEILEAREPDRDVGECVAAGCFSSKSAMNRFIRGDDIETHPFCDQNHSSMPTSGSSDYCLEHECVPDSDAVCFCTCLEVISRDTLPDGTPISFNRTESTQMLVSLPDYSGFVPARQNERRVLRSTVVPNDDTEVVTIYLNDHTMTMSFLTAASRHVSISKGELAENFNSTGLSLVVELSDDYFKQTGYLSVITYVGFVISNTQTVLLVGEYECVFSDCFNCWGAWYNFRCLPQSYQIAFTVWLFSWVGLFALLLLVLACSYKCIGACCKAPFESVWYLRNWRWKMNARKTEPSEERSRSRSRERDTGARSASMERRYRRYMSTLALVMLIGGVAAQQCDYSTVQTYTQQNCVQSGAELDCSISFNEIITMTGAGGTACVQIANEDGIIVGTIEFVYTLAREVTPLLEDYWTANQDIQVVSRKRCALTDGCSDEMCLNPEEFAEEQLQSSLSTWPHREHCDFVAGGVLNGCLVNEPSCAWSMWGSIPKDFASIAYKMGPYSLGPVVSYRIYQNGEVVDNGAEEVRTVFTDVGDTGMMVRISGEMQIESRQPITELYTHYMNSPIGAFIGKFSEKNSPEAGNVGDYQAEERCQLNNECDRSSMLVADMEIDRVAGQDGVAYSFVTPGVQRLIDGSLDVLEIPGEYFGQACSVQGDPEVICDIPASGTVSVELTTNVPYDFSVVITLVCPEVSFVASTGCHNCLEGAEITFKGRSTCEAGSVTVSGCSDVMINTKNAMLGTTEENFVIGITSSKKEIDCTFTFSSFESSDDVRVNLVLDDPSIVLIDDQDFSEVAEDDGDNFWDNLGDALTWDSEWYWSLLAWFVILSLAALGLFFIGLILAACLKLLLWAYAAWKTKKAAESAARLITDKVE